MKGQSGLTSETTQIKVRLVVSAAIERYLGPVVPGGDDLSSGVAATGGPGGKSLDTFEHSEPPRKPKKKRWNSKRLGGNRLAHPSALSHSGFWSFGIEVSDGGDRRSPRFVFEATF